MTEVTGKYIFVCVYDGVGRVACGAYENYPCGPFHA